MAHSDWMSELPDKLKTCPLSQIAIPGSHESGTSDINTESANGPDLSSSLKTLEKYGCCVIKKIIVDFSVCQNLSLTEQMQEGIRYLDLRLAYDVKTKDFYWTHGLLSTRFTDALTEIQAFVKAHSGEVLLLDFNHFYAMDYKLHVAASTMIMKYLSDFIYPMPYGKVTIPSLKQCVESEKRVLVFYHSYVQNMPFWDGQYIPSPWANTNNVHNLMKFLEENYERGRPLNVFYVNQGVVTPDSKSIAKNPFSSIRDISDKVNPRFVKWVRQKKIGPTGINICIVDFIEDFEYVPTLLALNK